MIKLKNFFAVTVLVLAFAAALTACKDSSNELPAYPASTSEKSGTESSNSTSKIDGGDSNTYGDISKEEYDKLYEEYTENAESGVDTNSNADVIEVLPSFQMIDEIFTDYYVAQNAVYYVNISDNSSWQDVEFTKGDYFGQVLYNTESRDLGSIEPGSSNVLPVGTELYESNEDKTVILAKVDDGFIPYVKIVEG